MVELVTEERYLGDIISKDGRNTKNIKARVAKGNGTINQIMSILEDICFGKYFFEVAVILRNSLFINSLIFNSEAWYNVTKSDLDELEKADEELLRKILECPLSTPKEMLYLELACLPIRFIIMGRRIMFLQYILKESNDSLINMVFQAQLANPVKDDWCQTARETLEELGLDLKLEEIKFMEKDRLKGLVKKACEDKGLEYLNGKKAGHSKVLHISHLRWETQPYLKPNQMSADEAKFIFLLRTRMLDVKINYRNKHADLNCPICESAEDDQAHLLACSKLVDGMEIVEDGFKYENIFESKVDEILRVSRRIQTSFKKRKYILKMPNAAQVNQC